MLTIAGSASAGWLAMGAGAGASQAATLAGGNAPSVSVAGPNVTLTWSASAVGDTTASGYTVSRYNTSGVLQAIGAGCSGTVAALTCTENNVPAGTWKWSVRPRHGANWVGAESGYSADATIVPTPVVTTAAIASSPNKGNGVVRLSGSYVVYANVSGSPTSVAANVSDVTTGATAVALSVCSSGCTIDGTTYGFSSAVQTQAGGSAPTRTFTVTATNAGGSHTPAPFSVAIDTTLPVASSLLWAGGTTSRTLDSGDNVTLTFSESLAVNSICSGWVNHTANQSVSVTAAVSNGSGSNPDQITLSTTAPGCTTFNFGTIDVDKAYVSGGVTFAATLQWSPGAKQFVLTLNACSTGCANVQTVPGAGGVSSTYTPVSSLQDPAGNAAMTTAVTASQTGTTAKP